MGKVGDNMRILQIIPIINIGGAQTMCENLCYGLKKIDKSNTIEIVSFYDAESGITNRLENNNFKIHYLGKHKGPDIKMFVKLVKVIREFKPDVIHTHLYALEYVFPALKISHLKNVKLIHTMHSVADKENSKRIIRFQRKLFRSRKVIPISISEEVQNTVSAVYDIDISWSPIIYNGIPLEKCVSKKNYSKRGNILHIGRFVDVKNHQFLIKLFKKVLDKYDGNLTLTLVGEGPLENNIKNMTKELNINNNVVFLGAQKDCYSLFEKSDLFVLTSKYEGMPMTVIEAMGSGVPCIVSNVGGLKDMILDGKNGVLCSNENDFFNAIIDLLNDDQKRKKMGLSAIRDSKKYSNITMANNYYKLYKGDN